jgi:hypothetical protein
MNKLLLFLGIIFFMGCCGPVTTNDFEQDYDNEYVPNDNSNVKTVTYCQIDIDSNEKQEYYLGENEAMMIITKNSFVNKALINPQQHCINSQEYNEMECYPIDEEEYEGMRHSWNMIKAFGTCTELEYDSKYFDIN